MEEPNLGSCCMALDVLQSVMNVDQRSIVDG